MGTAGTVTSSLSGTGTGMHYGSRSGSGTGFGSRSNIKCNKSQKDPKREANFLGNI
jgi:hypothetical protein